jgi:hypothetical protein
MPSLGATEGFRWSLKIISHCFFFMLHLYLLHKHLIFFLHSNPYFPRIVIHHYPTFHITIFACHSSENSANLQSSSPRGVTFHWTMEGLTTPPGRTDTATNYCVLSLKCWHFLLEIKTTPLIEARTLRTDFVLHLRKRNIRLVT